ncbi:MAG: MBL fold metallo-hydrolase [candidate division Zixibacteria bacterium]|nr:MBL fold metallo-hydrolase [candidate division Zixibacteria bacterium]
MRSGDNSTALTRKQRIEQSANFVDGKFVNAVPTIRHTEGSKLPILYSFVRHRNDRRPKDRLPTMPVDLTAFRSTPGVKAVWLGHSTVLLRSDSLTILIDPVFDNQTALRIGRTDRFQPAPLVRDSLPPIDIILISHDHPDHLEESTVKHLARTGSRFVVPLGVGEILEDWDVWDNQIIELDWWEGVAAGPVELVCTPARHCSGRGLFGVDKTLWSSWVVIGTHARIFYSGDTGFSQHFDDIGERFGPFDLTLMQIGAYDENWPEIHMIPEDAIAAQIALDGRLLLPVHWATFDLALHTWDDPIGRLTRAATKHSVDLVTPMMGVVLNLDSIVATVNWWDGVE